MKIQSLRLQNFRNYSDLELYFHPNVNLIIGDNAQGKTNVLEAISYCLSGEGFRQSTNRDLIKIDSPHQLGRVEANVVQNDVSHKLDVSLSVDKSVHSMDSKRLSRPELRKNFSVVVFSPDSLSIIKQGPAERRNLIDHVINSVLPSKTHVISDYAKCLKTRNKVIKDFCDRKLTQAEFKSIIDGLNTIFLDLATQLAVARMKIIKSILPEIRSRLRLILKDPSTEIDIEYLISDKSAIDWSANQVYNAIKSRLEELSDQEIRLSQTLVGPHKHDIKFILNGRDARFYASQGQQRSVILAFKVTQVEWHFEENGEYPVLLLDDVFSELDAEKQACLLEILEGMSAQIFLTTTDYDRGQAFTEKEKRIFVIKKGFVQRDGISVRESNANSSY